MRGTKEFIGEQEGVQGNWTLLIREVPEGVAEDILSLLGGEGITGLEVAGQGGRRSVYIASEDAREANRVLRAILAM